MTGLTRGTRVSYRQRNTIRHGVIVAIGPGPLPGCFYYTIRNDASGIEVNVLPQRITAIF